jgi:voltage-gated potassium channel Kch
MSENNNERSYGQGAQGEPTAPKATKVGLWTRFRYSFDNSIARGGAFVAWMFAAMVFFSIVLVFVALILRGIPALTATLEVKQGVLDFNTFWASFAKLFGKGGEPTWADRVIEVLYWMVTITVTASVTGFIVGAIGRTFEKLRKGKSPVIAGNHTLILGWSNRVFPILKELAVANANVRNATVVIFSTQTRDFMQDEIEARAEGLGKLKVVTRTGDPTNPGDLKRTNISHAKSIIILDADESGDATVVSTVLAVKSVNSNPNVRVIAELDDAHVIARVTAQASRQPGLAAVTLDLLDFDGDEIYFQNVPALAGKTYRDALLSFNGASVIGLVDDKGVVSLNPKNTTKLTATTKVIAIAEDDDKVVYTGVATTKAAKDYKPGAPIKRKAEHLLFIGWSAMGRSVLTELAAYLPKGSTVHIVAQNRYVDAALFENLSFGANVKVTHAAVTGDIHDLIAASAAKKYDEIIVLGYRNAISEAEADAQTMLTMLQMNQLFETDGNGVDPTRLVAEILDSRKAELARVAAVDDLVVSDNLAALLISQVSENPALAPVFDDLFDADGAAINVKPIEHYVPVGKKIAYAELVAIAAAHGESAIGYRVVAESANDASTGVRLNPAKTTEFTPAKGDSLIVIGDVE